MPTVKQLKNSTWLLTFILQLKRNNQMRISKFASKIVIKIKGVDFNFSENIPIRYLISIFVERSMMMLRGMFTFGISKRVFIAKRVMIKCKTKIKFEKNLSIGLSSFIDAVSIDGIRFGENVSLGKYTNIECSGSLQNLGKGLLVGNNVGMGTHGFWGCAGGVEIGNDTIFGNFVSIHSENHNFKSLEIPIRLQGVNRKGIKIGNNCWIGAKVTVLDGAIIEDGCIIAAGALVISGRYKSNGIYGGVPAKLIKYRLNE